MRNRTLRVLVIVGVVLSVIALLAGCSSGKGGTGGTGNTGGGSGSGPTVVEQNLSFQPSTLEVKVGDTVTFTNEDSAPHEVSIDGQNLGQQAQGESVSWKASKAGSYPYTCVIHPSMNGEIVVK